MAGQSLHTENVTAIAWTLVGLLTASLGVLSAALFSALARIDAVGASLGARIDAQGTDLRAEIRSLRDVVHDLDVRLTRTGG